MCSPPPPPILTVISIMITRKIITIKMSINTIYTILLSGMYLDKCWK